MSRTLDRGTGGSSSLVGPLMMWSRWLAFNWKQWLAVLILFLPLQGLLALFGHRLPHSFYYRNDVNRLVQLAGMRAETAETSLATLREYLRHHNIQGPLFARPTARDLCVGILTVARPGHRYLSQTVAGLLTRTHLASQRRVRITILNVEADPSQHQEAISLGDLLTVQVPSYRPGRHPDDYTAGSNSIKETLDYLAAMEAMDAQQCAHVLLLEDDALAAPNWSDTLLRTIASLTGKAPWLLLKAFSTFRFIGWDKDNWKDYILLPAVAISAAVALVSILVLFLLPLFMLPAHRRYKLLGTPDANSPAVNRLSLLQPNLTSFIFLAINTGAFLYLLGKYNVFRYGPGVHDIGTGASCVAIIYPRDQMMHFHDYLDRQLALAARQGSLLDFPKKDLHFQEMIGEGYQRTGVRLRELILLPNAFQHIGYHTSLDKWSSLETTTVSHHFPWDDLPLAFVAEPGQ